MQKTQEKVKSASSSLLIEIEEIPMDGELDMAFEEI
jgi:hypothetical protein